MEEKSWVRWWIKIEKHVLCMISVFVESYVNSYQYRFGNSIMTKINNIDLKLGLQNDFWNLDVDILQQGSYNIW